MRFRSPMALLLCARSRRPLLIASLLLAVVCSSAVYLKRIRTGELATRGQTSNQEDQNTAVPTTKLYSTKRTTSVSTGKGASPLASTTAPTKLTGVWWSKLNTSALPQAPDPQCSDPICSNFIPSLKCVTAVTDRNEIGQSITPICRFQNGTSKPKYLLRSYPGSGNTWVRQVLEKVTGICTGSIYCDHSIWMSGMIGEGLDSSSVLVVKTHDARRAVGDASILIVRHPINAIVSYWKWYLIHYKNIFRGDQDKEHVADPPAKYYGDYADWNKWVKNQVNGWVNLIKGQISRTNKPLLIVTYEDMKSNITREVFRMLNFLHVDYSRDKVLQRLNEDFAVFKRPKTQDFDPYTPQQRELVKTRLKEFLKSTKHKAMVKIIQQYLLEF